MKVMVPRAQRKELRDGIALAFYKNSNNNNNNNNSDFDKYGSSSSSSSSNSNKNNDNTQQQPNNSGNINNNNSKNNNNNSDNTTVAAATTTTTTAATVLSGTVNHYVCCDREQLADKPAENFLNSNPRNAKRVNRLQCNDDSLRYKVNTRFLEQSKHLGNS